MQGEKYASNIHANCTAIIPAEEGWAESVGMQNCDGAAVSGPHSFGLGHLARHHICRVDSNASIMRRNTAASHGTLVGINRLHLHHRQRQGTSCSASCCFQMYRMFTKQMEQQQWVRQYGHSFMQCLLTAHTCWVSKQTGATSMLVKCGSPVEL